MTLSWAAAAGWTDYERKEYCLPGFDHCRCPREARRVDRTSRPPQPRASRGPPWSSRHRSHSTG